MIHKSETGKRSHSITANFQLAVGASDGGRAHPRIADRFQDMPEMEQEAAQRAGA